MRLPRSEREDLASIRLVTAGKTPKQTPPESGASNRVAAGVAENRPNDRCSRSRARHDLDRLPSGVGAWVLKNRLVTATIAGPRTEAQWDSYVDALKLELGPDDEKLVDSPGAAGARFNAGLHRPRTPSRGTENGLKGAGQAERP